MVASNITLPNIRKLFIPDPGYVIVDADLTGADAQVVAWEADDEDLKTAFRAGLKIHLKNARDVFPELTSNMTDEEIKKTDQPGGIYYNNKRAVHGTNYGASPRAISIATKWPIMRCEEWQYRWFSLHPGIKEWHDRTLRWLYGTQCWRCNTMAEEPGRCKECNAVLGRTVGNRFGYRRIYFDRLDSILPEALAWVPQSTVAINTQRGMILIEDTYPYIQLLLQNHDSLVFQIPRLFLSQLDNIHKTLNTVGTPYNDPLYIPWGMNWSDRSWGDCK